MYGLTSKRRSGTVKVEFLQGSKSNLIWEDRLGKQRQPDLGRLTSFRQPDLIWPRGYEIFSYSTQLSMNFEMLISIKISRNLVFFKLR